MVNQDLPIKTGIVEGQRYFDEKIFVYPRPQTELQAALAQVFGTEPRKKVLVGYRMVPLRWVKPDGKGGFVPK